MPVKIEIDVGWASAVSDALCPIQLEGRCQGRGARQRIGERREGRLCCRVVQQGQLSWLCECEWSVNYPKIHLVVHEWPPRRGQCRSSVSEEEESIVESASSGPTFYPRLGWWRSVGGERNRSHPDMKKQSVRHRDF